MADDIGPSKKKSAHYHLSYIDVDGIPDPLSSTSEEFVRAVKSREKAWPWEWRDDRRRLAIAGARVWHII